MAIKESGNIIVLAPRLPHICKDCILCGRTIHVSHAPICILCSTTRPGYTGVMEVSDMVRGL